MRSDEARRRGRGQISASRNSHRCKSTQEGVTTPGPFSRSVAEIESARRCELFKQHPLANSAPSSGTRCHPHPNVFLRVYPCRQRPGRDPRTLRVSGKGASRSFLRKFHTARWALDLHSVPMSSPSSAAALPRLCAPRRLRATYPPRSTPRATSSSRENRGSSSGWRWSRRPIPGPRHPRPCSCPLRGTAAVS